MPNCLLFPFDKPSSVLMDFFGRDPTNCSIIKMGHDSLAVAPSLQALKTTIQQPRQPNSFPSLNAQYDTYLRARHAPIYYSSSIVAFRITVKHLYTSSCYRVLFNSSCNAAVHFSRACASCTAIPSGLVSPYRSSTKSSCRRCTSKYS